MGSGPAWEESWLAWLTEMDFNFSYLFLNRPDILYIIFEFWLNGKYLIVIIPSFSIS